MGSVGAYMGGGEKVWGGSSGSEEKGKGGARVYIYIHIPGYIYIYIHTHTYIMYVIIRKEKCTRCDILKT